MREAMKLRNAILSLTLLAAACASSGKTEVPPPGTPDAGAAPTAATGMDCCTSIPRRRNVRWPSSSIRFRNRSPAAFAFPSTTPA